MTKITYLLGAGASANALPLIKKAFRPYPDTAATPPVKPGLPEELREFVMNYRVSSTSRMDIIPALENLTARCNEFGTPDLLAKFLLEKGDTKNYRLLKRLLSNYFTYKQTAGFTNRIQAFDYRALTFLSTISSNGKLPENVKILSWNYDRQIEIAAEKMKPVNSPIFEKIRNFQSWPNYMEGHDGENFKDIPFLLHLNGVAGYRYTEAAGAENDSSVHNFDDDINPFISFAWEDDTNDDKHSFNSRRPGYLKKIAEGTEILVVIGYSFPFFNRKIDDEIFKTMMGSLTKIYFQDPVLDGTQLINQFNLPPKIAQNLKHIQYVDNYYVPFEL
jgi:hypothetical protein